MSLSATPVYSLAVRLNDPKNYSDAIKANSKISGSAKLNHYDCLFYLRERIRKIDQKSSSKQYDMSKEENILTSIQAIQRCAERLQKLSLTDYSATKPKRYNLILRLFFWYKRWNTGRMYGQIERTLSVWKTKFGPTGPQELQENLNKENFATLSSGLENTIIPTHQFIVLGNQGVLPQKSVGVSHENMKLLFPLTPAEEIKFVQIGKKVYRCEEYDGLDNHSVAIHKTDLETLQNEGDYDTSGAQLILNMTSHLGIIPISSSSDYLSLDSVDVVLDSATFQKVQWENLKNSVIDQLKQDHVYEKKQGTVLVMWSPVKFECKNIVTSNSLNESYSGMISEDTLVNFFISSSSLPIEVEANTIDLTSSENVTLLFTVILPHETDQPRKKAKLARQESVYFDHWEPSELGKRIKSQLFVDEKRVLHAGQKILMKIGNRNATVILEDVVCGKESLKQTQDSNWAQGLTCIHVSSNSSVKIKKETDQPTLSRTMEDRLSISKYMESKGLFGLSKDIDKAFTPIVALLGPHAEKFKRRKLEKDNALLFFGPPGTGKTDFARYLGEYLGLPVTLVSAPDLLSKYVGDTEKAMNRLFEKEGVVVIDEIDGIIGDRDDSQTHERSRVNKLLTLLDGFNKKEDVLVIAMTNLPDKLDKAMKRSGRFGTKIAFHYPDKDDRKKIFEYHLNPLKQERLLSSEIKIEQLIETLANETEGFGGADLKSVIRKSAFRSTKELLDELMNNRNPNEADNRFRRKESDFMEALKEVKNDRGDQIGRQLEE